MALCSKKALVQFIHHVRDCLLQETTIKWQSLGSRARGCGRVATNPQHTFCSVGSEGGAGLIQGERDGGGGEGGSSPAHTSASIFLLCSKLCRSHPSSILPTALFHSVSPLLLLPMEFLHFEIINFIHEKNQKISYACSQKNFGLFSCF